MTGAIAATPSFHPEVAELAAMFPRWRIWYGGLSGSWNASRRNEEPWFARPRCGHRFMVSGLDMAELGVRLEEQCRNDIRLEFPRWKVGRASRGGWCAVDCGPGRDGAVILRMARGATAAELYEVVRMMVRPEEAGRQCLELTPV